MDLFRQVEDFCTDNKFYVNVVFGLEASDRQNSDLMVLELTHSYIMYRKGHTSSFVILSPRF